MDAHGHHFALGLIYSELGLRYVTEALELLQR